MNFNNREEVIEKLNKLKAANLPHMTIEQFGKLSPLFKSDILNATPEEIKKIEEELYIYYRPTGDNKCIFNDCSPFLSWGLAHGVAYDEETGLSWVCYHYFKINEKNHKYEVTLQYHPDGYEID